ncbi:hypothetical protein [Telmatospirillum sp.]|uniref:hypothetical protein n=1 Tax=Telmatospirillum sp. TaxID=2079197 RepID=UPI0028478E86|nr:hypothetical protein [Telmatospirillum sp.]MDR3438982.1 hypothetical protein [Telmatospirillum sp.]
MPVIEISPSTQHIQAIREVAQAALAGADIAMRGQQKDDLLLEGLIHATVQQSLDGTLEIRAITAQGLRAAADFIERAAAGVRASL